MPAILVGIAAAIAVAVVSMAVYAAVVVRGLPEVGRDPIPAHSVIIYDRAGQVLAERNRDGAYHVILALDQMGANNRNATLAAEDRGFYQHGALNIPSAVRAALVDIVANKPVEGGSTITQQVVKIELLQPQRTLRRKIQEAFLASQLEQRYTKDQILELYLNRVYYGHGAYGIGSAAKTYFGAGKNATDLDVAQAAFLAGLLKAPSDDDPQTHFDRARGRQLYVLQQMADAHLVSEADAVAAAHEDIQKELVYDASYRQTRAPHFVDYVISRLPGGAAALNSGGYAVFTTLDPGLQALAEKSVAAGVQDLSDIGVNNGALLAARPSTGEILAWVGSADYNNAAIGGQFNVVKPPGNGRQPGSSFKPYVYEAALIDRKITLASCVQDQPTDFGGGYRPVDWDGRFMGRISARQALLLSRNVPAVAVAQKEGITNVISLAKKLGIGSPLQPNLATAIGSSEITMFDHVQGYQVFANQGDRVPLISITRIVGAGGDVIYDTSAGKQDRQQQVLTAADTYLITDVLKGYQSQWSLGWNRQMAGKSGTTGSPDQQTRDAWMMAYNPNIVIGTWAGNTGPNGAGGYITGWGTDTGRTILADFLNGLPQAFTAWYQQPSGLVRGDKGELYLSGTDHLPGQTCAGGGGKHHGKGNEEGGLPAPPSGGD